MAGRIRDDDVQAVKERTDLVQLVSQYLTLKKAGADRMVGLCAPSTRRRRPRSASRRPSSSTTASAAARGRRDQVPPRARAPQLRRGGRAAGPAGRRHLRYEGDSPEARRARPAGGAVPGERAGGRLFAGCSPRARRPPTPATTCGARHLARAIETFGVGYAPGYQTSCCAGSRLARPEPRDPAGGRPRHPRRRRARSATGSAGG